MTKQGLNRTSVGLKRANGCWSQIYNECLNRTSVGLKLSDRDRLKRIAARPQSNQRGIETFLSIDEFVWDIIASIEPAWD